MALLSSKTVHNFIEILFHIFDVDRSGSLKRDEVQGEGQARVRVLLHRETVQVAGSDKPYFGETMPLWRVLYHLLEGTAIPVRSCTWGKHAAPYNMIASVLAEPNTQTPPFDPVYGYFPYGCTQLRSMQLWVFAGAEDNSVAALGAV